MDTAACALLASSLADVACPCIEFAIEYSYHMNVHMNLWGSHVHISVSEGGPSFWVDIIIMIET